MYRRTASYTTKVPMITGQPHRKTIQKAWTRKKPTNTDTNTPARRSVPKTTASKKLGSLTPPTSAAPSGGRQETMART